MQVVKEANGVKRLLNSTLVRFVINGVVATAVHYTTLVVLMEFVELASAGLANALAAIVGITASYIGNYKQVFRSNAAHSATLPRFLGVYAAVAGLHGVALAIWTDLFGFRYHLGFVIATGLSVALTFMANRWLVFPPGSGKPDQQGGTVGSIDGRD